MSKTFFIVSFLLLHISSKSQTFSQYNYDLDPSFFYALLDSDGFNYYIDKSQEWSIEHSNDTSKLYRRIGQPKSWIEKVINKDKSFSVTYSPESDLMFAHYLTYFLSEGWKMNFNKYNPEEADIVTFSNDSVSIFLYSDKRNGNFHVVITKNK